MEKVLITQLDLSLFHKDLFAFMPSGTMLLLTMEMVSLPLPTLSPTQSPLHRRYQPSTSIQAQRSPALDIG
jgi:hypothetical protein